MKNVFLFLIVLIIGHPVRALEGPIQEYYIISSSNMPPFGTLPISWFFMRGSRIWQNGQITDIAVPEWPAWDTRQIPFKIIPVYKQKAFLKLFNSRKEPIYDLELKEVLSLEALQGKLEDTIEFYQIRLILSGGRIELASPLYPVPRRRAVAKCEVKVSDEDFNLEKSGRAKMCFETLKAYMTDPASQERQFYISVDWPPIKGRENMTAAQQLERELRSSARKREMIYLSQKVKSGPLRAEVGVTMREALPKIGPTVSLNEMTQNAFIAPDTKTVSKPLYERTTEDGSYLRVLALYSDGQVERRLESPVFGDYKVDIQFAEDKAVPEGDVKITQTRELELRTGVLGHMRSWQILGYGSANYLTSNRGETNAYLGLPGLAVKYNLAKWNAQPYLSFERQLLTLGSTLGITEMRVGFSQKIKWLPQIYYTLGYNDYSLSGENKGATRLGSFTAISAGLGSSQRLEKWILREDALMLYGQNSLGFDIRFELGKMIRPKSDEHYYIGSFLGYSEYRASIVNKINNRETFSEARLQLGLNIGWFGPESF